jgi:hypothetical protein
MTLLALGRRRLTVQFRIERTSADDTQSLEALHRRRLAMREADSRRTWWEIEHQIRNGRIA